MLRRSLILGSIAAVVAPVRAGAKSPLWLPHFDLPALSGYVISETKVQEEIKQIACPNGIGIIRPPIEPMLGKGKFSGDPIVRLSHNDRSITLLKAFDFKQSNGFDWSVPDGTISDGASIPRLFWSLVGAPLDGPYRNAAIIHDYYCDVRTRTWKDTHLAFLDGMLSIGVPRNNALKMYYAVYHFGPRWNLQTICNERRALIRRVTPSEPGRYHASGFEKSELLWTHPTIEAKIEASSIAMAQPRADLARQHLAKIDGGALSVAEVEGLVTQ